MNRRSSESDKDGLRMAVPQDDDGYEEEEDYDDEYENDYDDEDPYDREEDEPESQAKPNDKGNEIGSDEIGWDGKIFLAGCAINLLAVLVAGCLFLLGLTVYDDLLEAGGFVLGPCCPVGTLLILIGLIWFIVGVIREDAAKARAKAQKEWNRVTENLDRDFVLIDSNIWMQQEYDPFFEQLYLTMKSEPLRSRDRKLVLYGPQFDEICNIKSKFSFKHPKSKLARLALSRIEKFQEQNLLAIEPLSVESDRFAYADPLIIKLIVTTMDDQPSTGVWFLTDDKELRIRVRELTKNHPDRIQIPKSKQLMATCEQLNKQKNKTQK